MTKSEEQALRANVHALTLVVITQGRLLGHLSARTTNAEHVLRIRHDGGQDRESLRFPAGYSGTAYDALVQHITDTMLAMLVPAVPVPDVHPVPTDAAPARPE